jgi:hypothetical protein
MTRWDYVILGTMNGEKGNAAKNGDQPLSQPGGFDDQGWQEKIKVAKEARIQGQELRKDKPPAFETHRTGLSSYRKS